MTPSNPAYVLVPRADIETIIAKLSPLERQGEDYIWRPVTFVIQEILTKMLSRPPQEDVAGISDEAFNEILAKATEHRQPAIAKRLRANDLFSESNDSVSIQEAYEAMRCAYAISPKPVAGVSEDATREKIAAWMIAHSIPTGHGDSLDDLLGELSGYVSRLTPSRDAVLEEAALRIRHECPMCEDGYAPGSTPDDPIECEYCGRPMQTIRALKTKDEG